jgi:5-methylthioribose kinase
MREMHAHCPEHIPELYSFDEAMSVLVMQYLAPPHVVLRYGILEGHVYPHLAAQAARQMACCLFRTSMFKLAPEEFWAAAAKFDNPAMCDLTQQV